MSEALATDEVDRPKVNAVPERLEHREIDGCAVVTP
jgi:hypothetical protein